MDNTHIPKNIPPPTTPVQVTPIHIYFRQIDSSEKAVDGLPIKRLRFKYFILLALWIRLKLAIVSCHFDCDCSTDP